MLLATSLWPLRPAGASADTGLTAPAIQELGLNKYQINYFGDVTTVGKGTDLFAPEITMNRFGGTSYLKLFEPTVNDDPLSQKNATASVSDNEIYWASKDIAFKFYPVMLDQTAKTVNPDNYGFEYEIDIANSKAGTNAVLDNITFPIETANLTFAYQTPYTIMYTGGQQVLGTTIEAVSDTQVLDVNGQVILSRPLNVSGSYSVYRTSENPTETNKAFQIYRPVLIDDAGSTTRADIAIDPVAGTMTIDFSGIKTWLNKAKYPVVIDPTFGNEHAGSSVRACANRIVASNTDAAPTDGTMTYMHLYMSSGSGSHDAIVKGAVYDSSLNLVGYTEEGTVDHTSDPEWVVMAFVGTPAITNGQTYYFAVWSSNYGQIQYDAGSDHTYNHYERSLTYGTWPDPGGLSLAAYDRQSSIYVDYTTGGGTPGAENTPDSYAFGIIATSSHSDSGMVLTLINTGTVSLDATIEGTDAVGGGDTWTLSDTGTPGTNTFGLFAGISSYDVTVKKTEPYNTLISNLDVSSNQTWGLSLYMPTAVSGYDGQLMSCNVTLHISAH